MMVLCYWFFILDILTFFPSHLVIETSQEVHDVPYGDYFRVEVMSQMKLQLFPSCLKYIARNQ